MTRRDWCCMTAVCKSTRDTRGRDGSAGRISEEEAPAEASADEVLPARRKPRSFRRNSISGRALLAVIAIMTFLAALTLGAVVLVRSVAGDWQSAVAREITIQLRPSESRDIEADVAKAVALAQATPGIAGVRPYTQGGIRPAARALARQRARARRAAGAAPDRGAVGRGEPPDLAALAPAAARRFPARRSTIIAVMSTACARWRAAPW